MSQTFEGPYKGFPCVLKAGGKLFSNELVKELKVKEHKFLSIIPLSHAYEHTAGFFLPILIGAEIFFNENRDIAWMFESG